MSQAILITNRDAKTEVCLLKHTVSSMPENILQEITQTKQMHVAGTFLLETL